MSTEVNFGGLQIMVALANQQAAEGIRDVLMQKRVGGVFVPADNREAVNKLQDTFFNMVIIEEDFPELGGIDFCRFLRLTNTPIAVAPIIYGIHEPSREAVLQARDAGASKIALMPFSGASLIKAVQDALREARPIIQTTSYNGPCRRLRVDPGFRGPERRKTQAKIISTDIQQKILKGIL